MKSIIAATAILLEAALQAAAISPNIPPHPDREFSVNCVACGNYMASSGGGRLQLYQRNGNVWTIFGLRNIITTPATNCGVFGTQILIPDRDTLIVSDFSFDAPTPSGGTNPDRGVVRLHGKHYRIST